LNSRSLFNKQSGSLLKYYFENISNLKILAVAAHGSRLRTRELSMQSS